jgi:hypothetical protein
VAEAPSCERAAFLMGLLLPCCSSCLDEACQGYLLSRHAHQRCSPGRGTAASSYYLASSSGDPHCLARCDEVECSLS